MTARPNLARAPFADTRPVVVTAAILTLIAVVLTGLTAAELIGAKDEEQALAAELQALQGRRSKLAAEVKAADDELAGTQWSTLAAETSLLREVVAQRKLVWSDLLADLERILPWDVRLVRISPTIDENGEVMVVIEGMATSRQAWLRLLARLLYDDRFSDPVPLVEQTPEANNRMGYRFNLQVRYWPEGQS